jgi:hypothetical protein
MRFGAAVTGMPLAQRASDPCPAGQIRPFSASLACSAASRHARRRRDPPVERELADRHPVGQLLGVGHAHRASSASAIGMS